MMLRMIKEKIFRLAASLNAIWYRLKGIRIGRGCVITGSPSISRCKGSKIILRDSVVLHSYARFNRLIGSRMSIATITPEACIELHKGCGMSGSKIVCANRVSIGEYTIVGPETVIYDAKEHEYSPEIGWLGRSSVTGSPIEIGKRCYIGTRCIILKGVTIGDDCVIAAGSLINKDVPAGHLAMGNPAVICPLPERLGGKA